MLSKKFSMLLLIVAVAGAGFASWTCLQAKSATENVRPQVARAAKAAAAKAVLESGAQPRQAIPTSIATRDKPAEAGMDSQSIIEAFTEPYRDIAVAAAEMGTLAEIGVREGDMVEAGNMIAMLDDDVLRASLEVARRSMSIEGTLKSAQADLDMKSTDLEKLTQLRDRNHASQQEVDRIQTELKVSEARLLSVREDLEVKQLEFRRIEAQIEQRVVRAPIAGIVSEVQRESGEFVSPSDPMIARIVQLDPLLVVFSVPLNRRNDIAREQIVSLEIGDSHQPVEGTVEYVAPTPDPSNSSVRVKVRVSNFGHRFQSGERAVLMLDRSSGVPATEDPTAEDPTEDATPSDPSPIARREP